MISPPACAGCGKQLRTMQRRGQDWYCAVCGPQREPAGCGNTRPVTFRDRDGHPRCGKCPPGDGRDPAAVSAGIVATIDPHLPAEAVAAAVSAAAAQAAQRHRLAWALQDRPELLTGAGAQAPVPSVLRLIGRLADAGASGIVAPPCPHCGRVITLAGPSTGSGSAATASPGPASEPCSRCGAIRRSPSATSDGRPLCPHCLITDPANQETCASCGRPAAGQRPHPGRAALPGLPPVTDR